jgi:hypothetical protein
VKTSISGDFNNHKTKYKVINSISYNFSGTTTLAGEGPGLLVFDEPDTSESSFLADPVFTRRISKRKTQLPETCS